MKSSPQLPVALDSSLGLEVFRHSLGHEVFRHSLGLRFFRRSLKLGFSVIVLSRSRISNRGLGVSTSLDVSAFYSLSTNFVQSSHFYHFKYCNRLIPFSAKLFPSSDEGGQSCLTKMLGNKIPFLAVRSALHLVLSFTNGGL